MPGQSELKPRPVELHVEHLDGQHVAGLGTLDLDRAGGAVDEGQGDVGRRELLADMA